MADAGNRRLLKITNSGNVSVVYRGDPPYFPNGVFATPAGEVYVLEFSFTPPGTWGRPRVRKIAADGKMTLLTTAGEDKVQPPGPESAPPKGVLTQSGRLSSYKRIGLLIAALTVGSITILWAWHNYRKRQRV